MPNRCDPEGKLTWRRPLRGGVLAALLGMSLATFAAPAPWHVWRSRIDGREVCAQTTLGPGWEWARGPFRDSRCLTRARRYEHRFNWEESGVDRSQQTPRIPSKIGPE